VEVVLEPVLKNQAVFFTLRGETREIAALEDIPLYHKIAVAAIPRGAAVLKYGEEIGVSLCGIGVGEHVHVHNLRSRQFEPAVVPVTPTVSVPTTPAAPTPATPATLPATLTPTPATAGKQGRGRSGGGASGTFWGYRRPDGRVGIRNKIFILPASVCASDTTRIIASQIGGAVSFNNQNGCSQIDRDQQLTMDVMAGMAANPNVYGTVVVSLGCENCQMDLVVKAIRERTNKPLARFIIQENGGTIATIEKAVRAGLQMAREASAERREEVPLSELILGTNCGGSDPTSGLAANPLIGEISDRLAALGGTSVLSETTEFAGAEHILAARARTEEIGERIRYIVKRYEDAFRLLGADIRDGNPSPGNIRGGISTLEEKSLGCIHKGGHAPVEAVYDYAKQIAARGLVIMDTPGNDASSVAGMVAGGCQLVVFSTGRGTPTGNPIVPVIKVTANRDTWACMADNLDFDASSLIVNPDSLSDLSGRLFAEMIDVANGRLTRSETLGYTEMAIARFCNYV
jgi:altronate dehydratase large subunit